MKPDNKDIRPEKKSIAAELDQRVAGALYMILTDYSGMDMPQTTELKQNLRDQEASFSVVNNRMLNRALETDASDLLKGQTAMIYGSGDVVEVAKVIKKFTAENEKPAIKGGFLEGKAISAADVIDLAKLPSKDVLRAMLLGTLQAPCSQLVGVMDQKVASLVYVLDAVKGSAPKQARVYDMEYRPLIDRDLTDRAISFMKQQTRAKKPFFIHLPYTATHFPTMPHPDFTGKSGKGVWGDLLMQIDSYVGELLDTVDNLGIAENTIFIFTADNGPESLDSGETSLTVETAVHGTAGPWRASLFTGYEGALRVPFAIRWPGKIKAGGVSDEIVHEMDVFPTFARIVGGNVPQDRVMDGIDVSEFLLGKSRKSGRDGFVVYMGNEVFGVKWRDWKIHFKEQNGWNGVLREYTMPRVYNLINDPYERDNVLFPHTWVLRAGGTQLQEHMASLRKHPPIPTGTPDPYQPPK